ncbi:MAG: polysaccharide biosynthesis protein [Sphingobacteriales bacterium]|nr:MAG: polysaccharide biosynthesis protein [Sphingobacteriales bacterium]
MSSIKKLAGQTIWYGASSIAARFLNYLLTPYLTLKLSDSGYGEMSLVYAAIPFLNVIFTYGIETAYFRYVQKDEFKKDIYNTATVSLLSSTLFLTALLIFFNSSLANIISIKEHPEYITWSAFIIAFDTLSTLPFAKLRQDGRPVKFAFVRISGIIINILVTYFFLSVCPRIYAENPNSVLLLFYKPEIGVGYVIIANLVQSIITLLLLSKEFLQFRWQFNKELWKQMMIYSLPLIVAGFGGMINETFDRIMLGWWAPVKNEIAARAEVGIYSACYKLSILISLFIQAFRMGAEPFFFKQAEGQDAHKVYARVMKFFVIIITVMFLVVALYLDVWKYFIQNKKMWTGLKVVPILLLANMFLGIYYNLSIWYKLTNKTMAGAWITVIGAVITLIINYIFIPHFSYMACAWATFACYGSMMVISYVWGQKHYRIPYATKKLTAYIVIVVLLFFIHKGINAAIDNTLLKYISATLLLGAYCLFIVRIERKEFQKLPFIGKYI